MKKKDSRKEELIKWAESICTMNELAQLERATCFEHAQLILKAICASKSRKQKLNVWEWQLKPASLR